MRRPHRYEHKLPTKTGVSEYNRKYSTGKRAYSLAGSNPENDPSGSRMKMPNSQITNLQSSYRVLNFLYRLIIPTTEITKYYQALLALTTKGMK